MSDQDRINELQGEVNVSQGEVNEAAREHTKSVGKLAISGTSWSSRCFH